MLPDVTGSYMGVWRAVGNFSGPFYDGGASNPGANGYNNSGFSKGMFALSHYDSTLYQGSVVRPFSQKTNFLIKY